MNKKNLHQLLFLLFCLVVQNNALNAMKRSIDLISSSEKTKYPPLKQQRLIIQIGDPTPTLQPYSCFYCDQGFFLKHRLLLHIETHARRHATP